MPIDPLKLDTVAVLRRIDTLGGHARIGDLAQGRQRRLRVRACLRLAASERLVESPDGHYYRLTQKARDAIAAAHTATEPEAA